MSTIGPAELTAYLRGQLSALRRTATVARPADGTAGPAQPRSAGAGGAQSGGHCSDMATTLAARVLTLDRMDPDRRRKVFRMFLESLLLEEWGEQLINDPGFYQLVDSVHAQMEARDELRRLMDQAADHLLAPGGGR